MGWNTGWSIMEETVVNVYDTGALTLSVLEAILKPYKGTDMDMGGHSDLRAKDGKGLFEIVLLLMKPEVYQSLKDKVYTAESEYTYEEDLYDEFYEIRKTWMKG